MKAALRTAAALFALVVASTAFADAVPPPPTDCPRGQVGVTGHEGPRCVLEAPTDCPTGWHGQLGGKCSLRPCRDDRACESGDTCVEHAVCLHPVEDAFYDYGEEEAEKAGKQGRFDGVDIPHPDGPMLSSPALLAGPMMPKTRRSTPIIRYHAANLCSAQVACASPDTCQPEKICVPKGRRALAYRGKNVNAARVSRKTATPLPQSTIAPSEATAELRVMRGCAGCAIPGEAPRGGGLIAALGLAALARCRSSRWARVARAWISALFAALLALSLTGCNVVAMQQARMEGVMRAAGVVPKDQKLGRDEIRYWEGGRGRAVLLIHGFGGSATWLWHPQAAALAKDHRVIVPDLLWFGDSTSSDRDFSLDHQVRAVEALLDHLGEREVDVVGVSYGGLVAHELASDRPLSVGRMMIVDSPGRAYTRADYDALCRRMRVPHLGEVLVPSDPAGVERLLGLAYFDPPWVPDFALRQTITSMYSRYREERIALLDALLQDMDRLKARPVTLRARPMVVWGRQDPVFPLEIGQRLAASLGAPIHVLENARHAPNLERVEEFNRVLRGFLAGG